MEYVQQCGNWADLQDGGDEQPVPLQVLLVVQNVAVSQVHQQCFFSVLNSNKRF